MHVIGSFTIVSTVYPFDEELIDDTPVSFTNDGVTYHLEQVTTIPFVPVVIGLWMDSNSNLTRLLEAKLSVEVTGNIFNAAITKTSSESYLSGNASLIQDFITTGPGITIALPWDAPEYFLVPPLPSSSFGIDFKTFEGSHLGLFLGFEPLFSTSNIVHQSPVTIIIN